MNICMYVICTVYLYIHIDMKAGTMGPNFYLSVWLFLSAPAASPRSKAAVEPASSVEPQRAQLQLAEPHMSQGPNSI